MKSADGKHSKRRSIGRWPTLGAELRVFSRLGDLVWRVFGADWDGVRSPNKGRSGECDRSSSAGHEKAVDELWRGERHRPVAIAPLDAIFPLECDRAMGQRGQPIIGDREGVA